jgi:uncharacterized RDD family membrane protein YckC
VTKTCSQCGAVLPAHVRACSFCDSSLLADSSPSLEASLSEPHTRRSLNARRDPAWRSELTQRVESYRSRRGKMGVESTQADLPFERPPLLANSIAVSEPPPVPPPPEEDFSFTIAIGRCAGQPSPEDAQLLIDVSLPPGASIQEGPPNLAPLPPSPQGLYPVAPMEERGLAALIDALCLIFACGGFLALFSSLGGQFTFSRLSTAIYSIAFAIVYFQYFALFTVFGGTTPGMMLRGLRVVDVSGENPSPWQLLLRAGGYLISAGTFFLGFLWALWDEDSLTWHDRLSRTYLSAAATLPDAEVPGAIHQL